MACRVTYLEPRLRLALWDFSRWLSFPPFPVHCDKKRDFWRTESNMWIVARKPTIIAADGIKKADFRGDWVNYDLQACNWVDWHLPLSRFQAFFKGIHCQKGLILIKHSQKAVLNLKSSNFWNLLSWTEFPNFILRHLKWGLSCVKPLNQRRQWEEKRGIFKLSTITFIILLRQTTY